MCRTWGVPLYLRLGNRRGLIWKALVIWKHQVAKIAARHATDSKHTTLSLRDGASPTDLHFPGTRERNLKLRVGVGNHMVTNRRFSVSGEKKGKVSAAGDKGHILIWHTRNNNI